MPKTLRDHVFQAASRVIRSKTLGVRGVVVNEQGQVLLIRHTYTPGWYFPGGGVEPGETCQTALTRELKEEAGVELTGPMQLVSVHDNHAFFPNDHVLVFRIPQWKQGKATSRGEIAERGFFDPLKPPEGVSRGTARRLAELFGGAPASDSW